VVSTDWHFVDIRWGVCSRHLPDHTAKINEALGNNVDYPPAGTYVRRVAAGRRLHVVIALTSVGGLTQRSPRAPGPRAGTTRPKTIRLTARPVPARRPSAHGLNAPGRLHALPDRVGPGAVDCQV